jgi:hypothetical protein
VYVVRSVFKLLLAFGLIAAGAMMIVSGVQGASGAAPVNVSSTGPVAVSATMTAVPSGAAGAEVAGYGTDKDTYNRGDTAKGYIELKNTGNAVINDATIRVMASRNVPALGTASLGTKDFKLTGLGIKPGETKKAEFSVDIPKEYSGFSTAGDYTISGKVLVNDKEVGAFSKKVKVV